MNAHQEMLKSTFNEVLVNEIAKRLKNPTLNEIDLIMYFGDREAREKMNYEVLPRLVRDMHIIDLIRLVNRLDTFSREFGSSYYLVNDEIKKRKKMVDL